MLQYDYSTFALFERIAVNDAVECVKVARNGLAACSNAAGAIVIFDACAGALGGTSLTVVTGSPIAALLWDPVNPRRLLIANRNGKMRLIEIREDFTHFTVKKTDIRSWLTTPLDKVALNKAATLAAISSGGSIFFIPRPFDGGFFGIILVQLFPSADPGLRRYRHSTVMELEFLNETTLIVGFTLGIITVSFNAPTVVVSRCDAEGGAFQSLVVVNSSIVIVKTSHSIDEYSATIDGIMKWRASTFPNVPWGKLLNTKARAFLFDHQTALSVTQVGTLVVIKRLMDTWIPTAEIEMPRGWDVLDLDVTAPGAPPIIVVSAASGTEREIIVFKTISQIPNPFYRGSESNGDLEEGHSNVSETSRADGRDGEGLVEGDDDGGDLGDLVGTNGSGEVDNDVGEVAGADGLRDEAGLGEEELEGSVGSNDAQVDDGSDEMGSSSSPRPAEYIIILDEADTAMGPSFAQSTGRAMVLAVMGALVVLPPIWAIIAASRPSCE